MQYNVRSKLNWLDILPIVDSSSEASARPASPRLKDRDDSLNRPNSDLDLAPVIDLVDARAVSTKSVSREMC